MSALEQRVRDTLRHPDPAPTDGLADQVLARIERHHRRRRAIQGGLTAAAVVIAVSTALALRGGADLRATVPADPTSTPTAAPTPTPDRRALAAASAYLAAQNNWVQCLRGHGLQVHGPDANGDVSVNPDRDLQRQRDACASLQPQLSDDVERVLQPDTAPGGQVVDRLGEPVTVTRTGTATVQVGPAPAGGNALDLRLSCLTAGRFDYPDGAAMVCRDVDARQPDHSGGYLWEPPAGTRTVTIRATSGGTWQLTATWVRRTVAPFAVNQYGQTYGSGAGTELGSEPDLIAVEAGNGRTGYVYREDLDGPTPTSPRDALEQQASNPQGREIPMYKRDGRTRIGSFHLG